MFDEEITKIIAERDQYKASCAKCAQELRMKIEECNALTAEVDLLRGVISSYKAFKDGIERIYP